MGPLRSSPAVLLHHDGELADVRELLDELGAPYVERLGAAEEHERTGTWDLIIASPRRILHFRPDATGCAARRIAILDGDSRTLRAHLQRMHVDWMVRRPVHPAALRLLILHALYRGPERRRKRRVSVGAEVRYRSGLLLHGATLTDFSLRGCRLLARHAESRGRRIKLTLPAGITQGRPLRIKGTVVRSGPASRRDPGLSIMGVRFVEPSPHLRQRLEDVLALHASGPARLERPRPGKRGRPGARVPKPAPATRPLDRSGSETGEAPPPAPPPDARPGSTTAEHAAPPDRRRRARHAYDHRVVALVEQATRVLLGRDISTGGMRVDPHPSLSVGDRLELALHAGARSEPVVVDAVVQRDDGDRGLVLRFDGDEEPVARALESVIAHLPVIAGTGGDESGSAVIVSEIIERRVG